MKKVLKYGIVPCGIILGILIGVLVIHFKNNKQEKVYYQESDIIINQIEHDEGMSRDLDIQRVDHLCDCIFSDHMGFSLPDDLIINNDYGIYVRDNNGDYTLLHDIGYEFIGDDNRKVVIAYSTIGEVLRDYFFEREEKISKILGYDVVINQYKNQYFITFRYDDKYYDIETNLLTKEEMLNLVVGILNNNSIWKWFVLSEIWFKVDEVKYAGEGKLVINLLM